MFLFTPRNVLSLFNQMFRNRFSTAGRCCEKSPFSFGWCSGLWIIAVNQLLKRYIPIHNAVYLIDLTIFETGCVKRCKIEWLRQSHLCFFFFLFQDIRVYSYLEQSLLTPIILRFQRVETSIKLETDWTNHSTDRFLYAKHVWSPLANILCRPTFMTCVDVYNAKRCCLSSVALTSYGI